MDESNKNYSDSSSSESQQDSTNNDVGSQQKKPESEANLEKSAKKASPIIVIVLLIVAVITALLAYSSYNTSQAWGDFAKNCREIADNTIDTSNEGQAVYVKGELTSDVAIQDPLLGKFNAVYLDRNVEMFQNYETGTDNNKRHSKGWYDHHKYVSNYFYKNPDFPTEITKGKVIAEKATLGCFTVSKEVLESATPEQYMITKETYEKLPSEIRDRYRLYSGYLYYGRDPMSPSIGDVRVKYFAVTTPSTATIFAEQQDKILVPYKAKNNKNICHLHQGTIAMDDYLKSSSSLSGGFWFLVFLTIASLGGVLYFLSTNKQKNIDKDGKKIFKKIGRYSDSTNA